MTKVNPTVIPSCRQRAPPSKGLVLMAAMMSINTQHFGLHYANCIKRSAFFFRFTTVWNQHPALRSYGTVSRSGVTVGIKWGRLWDGDSYSISNYYSSKSLIFLTSSKDTAKTINAQTATDFNIMPFFSCSYFSDVCQHYWGRRWPQHDLGLLLF